MEKSAPLEALPLPSGHLATPAKQSSVQKWRKALASIISIIFVARYIVVPFIVPELQPVRILWNEPTDDEIVSFAQKACAQAEPLYPQSFDVSALVEGKTERIIDWLGGSVRVPTEIFDVMGPVGEDPRWEAFYKFADYLEEAFPLVHKHLTRTRVMTHALVFEWFGSDPSRKPLLLTGHQDVVPVLPDTRGLWTHDPYGGEYEKSTDRIWGRGSSDDKSGVIGMLSAVELLLESGQFTPSRTVILSLGIDEETGGKGAYSLGQWIEAKYGKDSMAMLVDEGSGVGELWGETFAQPAVGEKGYLDVEIRMETVGGHSSVPPEHTGIGYIAEIIRAMERNPHKPKILPNSPLIAGLSCSAAYTDGMPKDLKKAVHKVEKSLVDKDQANKKHAKVDQQAMKDILDWFINDSYKDGAFPKKNMGKALVSTTQAIDIINGGLKINALPEIVTAVVNHRISLASSVQETQDHVIDTIMPVAEEFNLALEAFGKDVELNTCPMMQFEPKAGKIIVSEAFNSSLNPAPISPYTIDNAAWRILSGTVKSVWATRPEAKVDAEAAKKNIYMAPLTSTGNTDTKRYWNLTRNIYRFAYQVGGKAYSNAHTVDESMGGETFREMVRWFMNFIVNIDESRDL